jgi:hypothetical protein
VLACTVGKQRRAGRCAGAVTNLEPWAGRWTFQLVEEYDDGCYAIFKDLERAARERPADGRRHLFEAAMKQRLRTASEPGHELAPSGR